MGTVNAFPLTTLSIADVAGIGASGIKFNFETSTTMAAPATGGLRLNNATIASATGAALNALSGETGNPSVLAWLRSIDDSTTVAHRGSIIIRKFSAQQNFAIFDVTGALVDNTTWVQLALTYVSGAGSFAAADVLSVQFIRTGDKGADGAGTGDTSTNTATSVVGEAVLFADTTGKLLKRSALTGIMKQTSGVAAAATAGTDFMKPDTTSALTAGFTSASVSAGTKTTGTYTFDPTAGAVQHVINGGAHTFAPPATHGSWILDYVNNASAGALTVSGWTQVDGDALDQTNTHSWRFHISVGNQGSYLSKKRMV